MFATIVGIISSIAACFFARGAGYLTAKSSDGVHMQLVNRTPFLYALCGTHVLALSLQSSPE